MTTDYVTNTELSRYINLYLDELSDKGRSKETLRRYTIYFKSFQFWLVERPLTQGTYTEYVSYLIETYSTSTVLSVCSQLNNFIKYLYDAGVLSLNLAWAVERLLPEVPAPKEDTSVDDAELVYLASAAYHDEIKSIHSLRAYVICELFYRFGLRVDEIIALRNSCVKSDSIVIERQGIIRMLPIESDLPALNISREIHRDPDDYLIRTRASSPSSPVAISGAVKRVLAFINYTKPFTPSSFRKAKTIELVRRGLKYYQLVEYLGCSYNSAKIAIDKYSSGG